MIFILVNLNDAHFVYFVLLSRVIFKICKKYYKPKNRWSYFWINKVLINFINQLNSNNYDMRLIYTKIFIVSLYNLLEENQ